MATKIPKIIHYCWLSGEQKPPIIAKCMETWQQVLPDYEFVCWDKQRFDVDSVPFVRDAVAAKKWAFAADYIRLYALYTQGGIYLDSDVMVYKSFNPFLNHSAFASIEFHPVEFYREIHKKGLYSDFYVGCNIDPAVMGAEKGNPFYKACLDHYQTLKFENTPKALESLIMPRVISRIAARNFGFKFCPAYQKLDGDFCIYPSDVFSGSLEDSEIRHSLHLGANTWGYKSEASGLKQRVRALAIRFLKKYFPKIFAYVKGKRVA